jgi:hypothetical protein
MDGWSDMSDCPNCGYVNHGEDELHITFLPFHDEQKCETWVVPAKEEPWMKSSYVRDVRN